MLQDHLWQDTQTLDVPQDAQTLDVLQDAQTLNVPYTL